MPKQVLAIANCRVSSDEQLLNNSLKRQRDAVIAAAEKLEAKIPKDGWWTGSVSSKKGNNLKRKDIQEMLDYCKKNKSVKYLIVDEPDRFMRSIDEAMYLEMTFKLLGVRVWYASDEVLNSDDLIAKMTKFMKYFIAEGSNDDRQNKSIKGQTTALREGRYTFHPKSGYYKVPGAPAGWHDIHPERGIALQKALVDIAERRETPTQALINLNNSGYTKTRAPLKMDKFRIKAIDPFYAGILEMDKQVKVRNLDGLHEPLISVEQHQALVEIFSNKKKTQSGPLKEGNPKYPLNNIVHCELCTDKPNGRYVGYDHGNGKSKTLVYEKYRCRGCGRYLSRQELHEKIVSYIDSSPITRDGIADLNEALEIVWKEEELQIQQDVKRCQLKIDSLEEIIKNQVEAATDPSNASIKQDILDSIQSKKEDIDGLKEQLDKLQALEIADKEEFLNFAFDFVDNTSSRFLEISKQDRLVCKQLLFPAGFYLDERNKVYTPEISPLYRLATRRTNSKKADFTQMVRMGGL